MYRPENNCHRCGITKKLLKELPMTNYLNEADHNRLTVQGLPCAYVRIDAYQYNSARAIFGTSSEDDDKRLYRALQAYEHAKNERRKADSDIDIDDGA